MNRVRKPRRAVILVVAFVLAALLSPIHDVFAAGISDCSGSAASSQAHWTSSKGYTFTTTQRWCAYNASLDRRLVWQSDGNLVAYTGAHSGGIATWNTRTYGYGSSANKGARLAFQTDGNVVIYNAGGVAIWTTNTYGYGGTDFYFGVQPGPNLATNGAGAVASMHADSEQSSRWYVGIQGSQINDGSGELAPVGRLTGWQQTLEEDFNVSATGTNFDTLYGDSWYGYGDGTGGKYYNSQVVSAHNGVMDFSVDGNVGAAGAFGPLGSCWGQTYGRYSMRFKATGMSHYQVAAMLWPTSDIWGDGEIDYV